MNTTSTPTPSTLNIFISYSHENEIWLTEWPDPAKPTPNPRYLLKLWERTFRNDGVRFWFDRDADAGLRGGEAWRDRIFEEIDTAHVGILLITQDFVTSPFIMDEELPRLVARYRRGAMQLLPILLQPTRLKDLPIADFVQFVPGGPTPLSKLFETSSSDFEDAKIQILDALAALIAKARQVRDARTPAPASKAPAVTSPPAPAATEQPSRPAPPSAPVVGQDEIAFDTIRQLAVTQNYLRRDAGWKAVAGKRVRWTAYVFDIDASGRARLFIDKAHALGASQSMETATIYLSFAEGNEEEVAKLDRGVQVTFDARLKELRHFGGPPILGIVLEEGHVVAPGPATARTAHEHESFELSNEGHILAMQTRLEWLFFEDTPTSWEGAKAWISRLEGGSGGWRLPTVSELKGLYRRNSRAGNGWSEQGYSFVARMDPSFARIGRGTFLWADTEDQGFNFGTGHADSYIRPYQPTLQRAIAVRVAQTAAEKSPVDPGQLEQEVRDALSRTKGEVSGTTLMGGAATTYTSEANLNADEIAAKLWQSAGSPAAAATAALLATGALTINERWRALLLLRSILRNHSRDIDCGLLSSGIAKVLRSGDRDPIRKTALEVLKLSRASNEERWRCLFEALRDVPEDSATDLISEVLQITPAAKRVEVRDRVTEILTLATNPESIRLAVDALRNLEAREALPAIREKLRMLGGDHTAFYLLKLLGDWKDRAARPIVAEVLRLSEHDYVVKAATETLSAIDKA